MNTTTARWLIECIRGLGGEADIEPDGRTAALLMEPALAASLSLPEFATLPVGGGDGDPASSHESQLLIEKCASLTADKGSFASAAFDPGPGAIAWPSASKAESFFKLSRGKLEFHEARGGEHLYAVRYARYSAVSDEKRESIASAAVNIETGTVAPGLGPVLEKLLEENRLAPGPAPFAAPPARVSEALDDVLRAETSLYLGDFGDALAKRLSRDRDRVYSYYKEIVESASSVSGRKKSSPQEIAERLEIIKREYAKKIDDLRVKYLMKVTITPLAFLTVRVPCLTASFTVQMGNARREIAIPWNPITARPDVTICQQCRRPSEIIRLCREFHWLCSQCWGRCAVCEKNYCPLCKPKGCTHG